MTALDIVSWSTLVEIILALSLTLFTRYVYPTLKRKSHCAWCWKSLHLMQWYPRRWSSTICLHHNRQIRAQSAARRLARQRAAAATRPAIIVLQDVKEVQA
jgi:hypothetical protein